MTHSISGLLRDQRAARAWFALEVVALFGFWTALVLVPEVRPSFMARTGGEHLLWGFASADSTTVIASAMSAIGAGRRADWAWVAMLCATVAWSYPAVYSLSLAVAGHGMELAAALMIPVALVNLAFAAAARARNDRINGRQAHHARPAINVLKTCGELLVLWTAFLWLMPTLIERLEVAAGWTVQVPEVSKALGITALIVGTTLLFWSACVMAWKGDGTPFPFDAPRNLVLDGPYRYVRNPQVIGGVLQGISLMMFEWSPLILAYVVAGVALWQLVLRPWEESDLSDRFGAAYDAYRDNVRCWLPRLAPYSPVY